MKTFCITERLLAAIHYVTWLMADEFSSGWARCAFAVFVTAQNRRRYQTEWFAPNFSLRLASKQQFPAEDVDLVEDGAHGYLLSIGPSTEHVLWLLFSRTDLSSAPDVTDFWQRLEPAPAELRPLMHGRLVLPPLPDPPLLHA